MKRISAFHFAAALVLIGAMSADAADIVNTQDLAVRVDKLADGLQHPWAVEVLPDGAYLVTERPAACASSATAGFPSRSAAYPRSALVVRAA